MKIIIASDSYKGSLSSIEAGVIIQRAFREQIPGSVIEVIPMADGGEGTVDSLVFATGGTKRTVTVTGPLMEPCTASYGILGDRKTVVIETAAVSGLTMLPPERRNPLFTTTYGIGELIRHCISEGYFQFIIGLGGSATNDGGLGMLQALGGRFLDDHGMPVHPIGSSLTAIKKVDFSHLDPGLSRCKIRVACDVENPLCGPNGASMVYGPQKGASKEQAEFLDQALWHYADLVERQLHKKLRDIPGAGAAGGLGFALLALGAELLSGARMIAEAADLPNKMKHADWVVTGEGRSDFQTLYGKAPVVVAKMAKSLGVKTILISGSLGEGYERLHEYFVSCHSITMGPMSLSDCMLGAERLLYETSRNIARLLNVCRP